MRAEQLAAFEFQSSSSAGRDELGGHGDDVRADQHAVGQPRRCTLWTRPTMATRSWHAQESEEAVFAEIARVVRGVGRHGWDDCLDGLTACFPALTAAT